MGDLPYQNHHLFTYLLEQFVGKTSQYVRRALRFRAEYEQRAFLMSVLISVFHMAGTDL